MFQISSEFQSFILKLSEDLCSIPEWKMFMRSLIGGKCYITKQQIRWVSDDNCADS